MRSGGYRKRRIKKRMQGGRRKRKRMRSRMDGL